MFTTYVMLLCVCIFIHTHTYINFIYIFIYIYIYIRPVQTLKCRLHILCTHTQTQSTHISTCSNSATSKTTTAATPATSCKRSSVDQISCISRLEEMISLPATVDQIRLDQMTLICHTNMPALLESQSKFPLLRM